MCVEVRIAAWCHLHMIYLLVFLHHHKGGRKWPVQDKVIWHNNKARLGHNLVYGCAAYGQFVTGGQRVYNI